MNFFPYLLLITFVLTIPCIRLSSISSSNDGPITNQSIIELYKHRSKRYSHDSQDRIIGGIFVKDFRKYPFMVFVRRWTRLTQTIYQEAICGGTLISTTHVLTAAHCVKHYNCTDYIDDYFCNNVTIYKKEDYTLYFGNVLPNNSKVSRTLKDVHIHPEYKYQDMTRRCFGRFDIAVLELSTPVRYSQRIARIKLPKPVTLYKDDIFSTMTSSFFDTKKECIILGWGKIAKGDSRKYMTRPLKVAQVPLIGHARCINFLFKAKYFPMKLINEMKKIFPTAELCTDTSICSKCPHDRRGMCSGDSGGPIICDGVQVGVDSYSIGNECVGLNLPTVYTRVDINVHWIRGIMSHKYYRMQHEY